MNDELKTDHNGIRESELMASLRQKTVAYTMLAETTMPFRWCIVFTDKTVLSFDHGSRPAVNLEQVAEE